MIYPKSILDKMDACARMDAWCERAGIAYARAVGKRGIGHMDSDWVIFFLTEMRYARCEQARRKADLVASIRRFLGVADV